MDWKNMYERMLKIMKCFLVLVLHCETPGFPLTMPLVTVDLCSGLWLLFGPTQGTGSVFTGQAYSIPHPELASLPSQPCPILYLLARTYPVGCLAFFEAGLEEHRWTP